MTALSIAPEITDPPDDAETLIAEAAVRFWAHVDRNGECWIWHGAHDMAQITGRRFPAERVAWELSGSGSLDRIVLDRTCGSARCVRPDHHVARPHARGQRVGRAPGGVLTAVRAWLAGRGERAARAERAPKRSPKLDAAPVTVAPVAAAVTVAVGPAPSALLRGPDTEGMTFLNRAGTLVRVFPGGATIITPAGEFHDPDLRRAVHKAMVAEGRAAA